MWPRARTIVRTTARTYYAAPRPVYVVPGYRHDNGRHNGWYKNGKAYGGYGKVRYYDGRRDGRRGRRR